MADKKIILLLLKPKDVHENPWLASAEVNATEWIPPMQEVWKEENGFSGIIASEDMSKYLPDRDPKHPDNFDLILAEWAKTDGRWFLDECVAYSNAVRDGKKWPMPIANRRIFFYDEQAGRMRREPYNTFLGLRRLYGMDQIRYATKDEMNEFLASGKTTFDPSLKMTTEDVRRFTSAVATRPTHPGVLASDHKTFVKEQNSGEVRCWAWARVAEIKPKVLNIVFPTSEEMASYKEFDDPEYSNPNLTVEMKQQDFWRAQLMQHLETARNGESRVEISARPVKTENPEEEK